MPQVSDNTILFLIEMMTMFFTHIDSDIKKNICFVEIVIQILNTDIIGVHTITKDKKSNKYFDIK